MKTNSTLSFLEIIYKKQREARSKKSVLNWVLSLSAFRTRDFISLMETINVIAVTFEKSFRKTPSNTNVDFSKQRKIRVKSFR